MIGGLLGRDMTRTALSLISPKEEEGHSSTSITMSHQPHFTHWSVQIPRPKPHANEACDGKPQSWEDLTGHKAYHLLHVTVGETQPRARGLDPPLRDQQAVRQSHPFL